MMNGSVIFTFKVAKDNKHDCTYVLIVHYLIGFTLIFYIYGEHANFIQRLIVIGVIFLLFQNHKFIPGILLLLLFL